MVRLSLALTASFLLFWISVLGSSNYLLYNWRSPTKALSPRVFELLMWSRFTYNHRKHKQSHYATLPASPSDVAHYYYYPEPQTKAYRRNRGGEDSYNLLHGIAARSAVDTTDARSASLQQTAAPFATHNNNSPTTIVAAEYTATALRTLSPLADSGNHVCCYRRAATRPVRLGGVSSSGDSSNGKQRRSSAAEDAASNGASGCGDTPETLPTTTGSISSSNKRLRRKQRVSRMSTLLYRGSSRLSSRQNEDDHEEEAAADASTAAATTTASEGAATATLSLSALADTHTRSSLMAGTKPQDKEHQASLREMCCGLSNRRTWNSLLKAPARTKAETQASAKADMNTAARPVSAQYRKRALALRRASGQPTKTLVAPDELTASAILPEEPNGITSMIAISTVLIFATFAAF